MNKDNKKGTANTPKRLTIQDLKKILGGMGSNVAASRFEDSHDNKAHLLKTPLTIKGQTIRIISGQQLSELVGCCSNIETKGGSCSCQPL